MWKKIYSAHLRQNTFLLIFKSCWKSISNVVKKGDKILVSILIYGWEVPLPLAWFDPFLIGLLRLMKIVLRSSIIQIGQGVLELSCAQELRSIRGTPPSRPIRPIFNRAPAANKSSVASKFHSNPLISTGVIVRTRFRIYEGYPSLSSDLTHF